MLLLALLGPFTDRNDRFPYPSVTLPYTIPSEIPTILSYTSNLKKVQRYPYGPQPPLIGHYRNYPTPTPRGRAAIKTRQDKYSHKYSETSIKWNPN